MDNEQKQKQAQLVYRMFCNALDGNDWKYRKDDEKMKIECSARGDDLPIELNVHVDAERQLLMILSHIPFVVAEDKRIEAAVAICAINNMLVDGCFDFDSASGHIFFRATNSFLECVLSEDVCIELMYKVCQTVDEYNDKLLMLSKGIISLEKFLTAINE